MSQKYIPDTKVLKNLINDIYNLKDKQQVQVLLEYVSTQTKLLRRQLDSYQKSTTPNVAFFTPEEQLAFGISWLKDITKLN